MECVAFEFVFDSELENQILRIGLFADLSMVTIAKHLWSTSRQGLCKLV